MRGEVHSGKNINHVGDKNFHREGVGDLCSR